MTTDTDNRNLHIHLQDVSVSDPDLQIQQNLPPEPDLHHESVNIPELDGSGYSLLHMVLAYVGVSMHHYRIESLASRIPACLRALHVQNCAEACARLRLEPTFFDAAVNALLIGATHFFRDPADYNALRETIIPDLLSRKANCRVLSIACADGAELYSLAICLEERQALQKSFLLGIDCRAGAISAARRGCYNLDVIAHIPALLRERYLTINACGAVIQPELRRSVQWEIADAFQTLRREPWDLILCRNFASYLQTASAGQLWRNIAGMLAPGGYLMAGKAEEPTECFVRIASCLYQKAGMSA